MFFEIWRFYDFSFFFSKKLDIKSSKRSWIFKHIVGCYHVTLKCCKSSVQVRLLESFCFLRFGVFMIFHFFFSKKFDIKNSKQSWIFKHIVGCYLGTLKGCKPSVQVWLLKFLWFSSYGVFVWFFLKFSYKKTNRIWVSQPYSGWLSGYPQGQQT